jgi:hypothetical protein
MAGLAHHREVITGLVLAIADDHLELRGPASPIRRTSIATASLAAGFFRAYANLI